MKLMTVPSKEVKNPFVEHTVFWAGFGEVERVFSKLLGKPFSIVEQEEAKNDISLTFNVTGNIDRYQFKEIAVFMMSGTGEYLTQTVLDFLCGEGFLEPGAYVIDVSW